MRTLRKPDQEMERLRDDSGARFRQGSRARVADGGCKVAADALKDLDHASPVRSASMPKRPDRIVQPRGA